MLFACYIPKAINTHPQNNTYCFSTATMFGRTRHIVVLQYIACLAITKMHCVYCAVRAGSSVAIPVHFYLHTANVIKNIFSCSSNSYGEIK